MKSEITISGKKVLFTMLSVLMIFLLFYFSPDSEAGVTTLNITNQEKTINEGQSFQIKLNGIKPSKVKWKSSKSSVATITKKGIVKGIAKGKAVIKGNYKGLVFNIVVYVKEKPSNSINYGDTILTIKGPQIVQDYGSTYLRFSGTFTNNGSTPICFAGYYRFIIYVNGVYTGGIDRNTGTPVKDGASVEYNCDIEVNKGDKVEVELVRTTYKGREAKDEVVYSTTYNVK